MIDLQNETSLSLSAAARKLPPNRGGRPVHPSCILRWVQSGVRTADGRVIRLEAVRLGGRWLTSAEALQRFAEEQTPRLDGAVPIPRPPARRQRAVARARERLRAVGI